MNQSARAERLPTCHLRRQSSEQNQAVSPRLSALSARDCTTNVPQIGSRTMRVPRSGVRERRGPAAVGALDDPGQQAPQRPVRRTARAGR